MKKFNKNSQLGKPLSPRERSIVETWNLTIAQQALLLNLSQHTIKEYRHYAISKLGFTARETRDNINHPEIKKCNLQYNPEYTEFPNDKHSKYLGTIPTKSITITCPHCGAQIELTYRKIK